MVIELIQNVALLLALCSLFGYLKRVRWAGGWVGQALSGLLFGGVAVVGMMVPWHMAPGLIFDGRSIVISLSGLFGGPVGAAIAALMAGIYRISLGGTGTPTGVGVIVTSAALGVAYHYYRRNRPHCMGVVPLYGFGMAVHLAMLLCMLILPWPLAMETLRRISLPVLVIFPAASLLLAGLLHDQEEHLRITRELHLREATLASIFRAAPVGIGMVVERVFNFVNERLCAMLGYSESEFRGRSARMLYETDQEFERVGTVKYDQIAVQGVGSVVTRFRTKAGDILDVLLSSCPIDPGDRSKGVVFSALDITEERRSREALVRSERFLTSVIDQNPGLLQVFDDKGTLIRSNPACRALMGSGEERIGNYNILEDPAIERQGLLPRVREVFESGRAVDFELHLEAPGPKDSEHENAGRPVILAATLFPIKDEAHRIVNAVVHARDITEQRQAERERDRLFNFSVDMLSIAGIDGYFKELNPAWRKTLGWSLGELKAKPYLEFVHPEDRPDTVAAAGWLSIDNVLYSFENRYFHKDGSYRWLSWNAFTLPEEQLIFSVTRDVTERKMAEEQARRYENRLETLRQMDRSILLAQSPEEIAQAAIRYIRRLIACTRAAVISYDFAGGRGTRLAAAINGATLEPGGRSMPLAQIDLAEALQRGEIHAVEDVDQMAEPPAVVANLKAEGIRSYIAAPLRVEENLIGALYVSRDEPGIFTVEEREIAAEVATQLAMAIRQSQLREQIRRHAEELEYLVAERTAEVEAANQELKDFVYSVSHDLRAPLRAINGFAGIISRHHAQLLDDEGRHYFDNISQASTHMGELIEGLLRYSRLGRKAFRSRAVDLNVLLADVRDNLAGRIQQLGATLILPEDLATVHAPPELLHSVFSNLIDNALTYHRPEEPPRITVASRREPDRVVLSVRDNGIGIAPEHHQKIFQIFQRLHAQDEYPGTGIGLAIVAKCVDLMGGTIRVQSEPGRGSEFLVEIMNPQ